MSRHFLFRHYWWIAIVIAICAITLIMCLAETDQMPFVGSVVATVLAFCYFVQQQRLAETILFKQLFTEFNCRYDKLNDKLLEIAQYQDQSVMNLEQGHRNKIVDYFNLCGEEYLFYKEGYIHRDVWRSWCRGMLWYMEKEPFLSIWNEELTTESYYGLSLAVIRAGAAS